MKLVRLLLFPFAILYDLITSIRNWLYDIGVFKSTSFDIPVIAVGNLSVGGTGKTPQVEYLVHLLKNDYKIAILSRGYKRKTKGFLLLNNSHSAIDVGDEPLQYYKKFGNEINVAVDVNRTNGIKQLLSKTSPEIILLDDAFQHRKVKASIYILLTKYNDLYVDDYLLPTGNLRENRRGAKRADIVIVTKCPADLSLEEQNQIRKKLNLGKTQALFFSAISYDENLKGEKNISIDSLKNKEIVLITGIANPKPLVEYLNNKGVKIHHLKYPDHYYFSNKDIEKIKSVSKGKIILTTEKDFVRLQYKINNLYYIEIKNNFINEIVFDEIIENRLNIS